MIKNSIPIFYEGNGKIRTVTKIADVKKTVDQNTYTKEQTDCTSFSSTCYLDDPYEGELFAVMMSLFAPFSKPTDKSDIWNVKRAKLQPAYLSVS